MNLFFKKIISGGTHSINADFHLLLPTFNEGFIETDSGKLKHIYSLISTPWLWKFVEKTKISLFRG